MDDALFHLMVNYNEATNRLPFDGDLILDLDVFASKWAAKEVSHPIGQTRSQGFSNRCATEAVLNVAESMGLPLADPAALYKKAKSLDNNPSRVQRGSWLWANAEVYCREHPGVKWVHLPNVEYVGKWLNLYGSVAVVFDWQAWDEKPGFGSVLEGGGGFKGFHAACLYGYEPAYQWRRYPFLFGLSKRRVAPCFKMENTNSVSSTTHLPVSRLNSGLVEAIALVKK